MSTTGTYLGMALAAVGLRSTEADLLIIAADELTKVAKELRANLEPYMDAPDPFAALISTMHNNREFEKFSEEAVDTGTETGVQASPTSRGTEPTR